MRIRWACLALGVLWSTSALGGDVDPGRGVPPLVKARCVKCHGPAKREGKLNLATPKGFARGGKGGAVVVPGRPEESPLWERVEADEMPPEEPLSADEKDVLRRWIAQGAPGLPPASTDGPEGSDHWAFAPLTPAPPPEIRDRSLARTAIDRFLLAALEDRALGYGPETDRATLIRRVSFDLTGLPPSPEEIARFRGDPAPDAYEQMVERFLASPHYGERLGKDWLDAAGYADSNGYFAADTDRPLAYRYRDYVIRSWNEDRPLDRFIVEQLAGDELAGFRPGGEVTPETIEHLVATHYLRNSPDGTGESDGNPDELRADRYAVLEGTTQALGASLFGLTFQCARCHDHKFEPITQRDYYALYAILWPSFDVDHWVKPQERIVEAPLPHELAAWKARTAALEADITERRSGYADWVRQNRETGEVLFQDDFDSPGPLSTRWSATAPGDDQPAGVPPVQLDTEVAPGARVVEGTLRIKESGAAGDRAISTLRAFDWTPDEPGAWIGATFDLVETRLDPQGKPAERIGFFLALHDFDDDGPDTGGNILFDGKPPGSGKKRDGGAEVHVDYPGADSKGRGPIGTGGYEAGRTYGVRVTNRGEGRFLVEHLVDWVADEKTLTLAATDLPDGGFGFEYCCGRSFIVDNVRIEAGGPATDPAKAEASRAAFSAAAAERRKAVDDVLKARDAHLSDRPGRIAWVADRTASPPPMPLLRRGLYTDPGPEVAPAPPGVLSDPDNPYTPPSAADGATSTGRRLAFARWLTRAGSRPSALLARVLVNRIWQHHFGTGLVPTPENFGYSGTPPSHPELLEYLAGELVRGGWRPKSLHRAILHSAAYRQASAPRPEAARVDPDNRGLWRFPVRRLDAEAIRDAMLAATGELDRRPGGPYVPTSRREDGEIVVEETAPGARRRSVYLQQRRTQVLSLLEVFDAPSIVTTCTRRTTSTIPLQSLSLLNSDFLAARARALARRLEAQAGTDDDRIGLAFGLAIGRPPDVAERAAARRFLAAQPDRYPDRKEAVMRAWVDLGQMILASNAFLYLD